MSRKWIYSALISVFFATSLLAQGSGLYLGGSLGRSLLKTNVTDINGDDLKLDQGEFAYKLFGGFELGQFIGIEAGYRNLGTVNDTVSDTQIESKTDGFDVQGVGSIGLGPVDVFGKAGFFFWENKSQAQELSGSRTTQSDGTDFAWGFGVGFGLGKITLRGEWERFEIKDVDRLSLLSVGASISVW